MYCSNCGNQLPDGAAVCPNCGTAIKTGEVKPEQSQVEQQSQAPASAASPAPTTVTVNLPPIKLPDSGTVGSFLNFDTMITPMIIKIIYIIGVIGCFISGIAAGIAVGGAAGFFVGILAIIGLQVALRIYCELMMLFFGIRKDVLEIKRNMK